MILIFALLLPLLFWDKGPETAPTLRNAGIQDIAVPNAMAPAWKGVAGFTIQVIDPTEFVSVPAPSIDFRMGMASATREPWVNSNGWRFIRRPDGHFLYHAPGKAAGLATAEAFMYDVHAAIQTDPAGLASRAQMLQFLKSAGENDFPALVNIGYVDNGSAASGEVMNLLVRRNLLFRVVPAPDPKMDINVVLGSAQYPETDAKNPSLMAEKVRANLTDDKRLLRIYGTYEVVGRLTGSGSKARLYLLNYAAARTDVNGIRVRVLGHYENATLKAAEQPGLKLMDFKAGPKATEFTIPKLVSFAIVDLSAGRPE